MATLHVLQGPDKGTTLSTQNDDIVLLGRGSDRIPLTDQTVSRRHAELRRSAQDWELVDLSSANGTFVNGRRVTQPVRLKHGDQIKVGSTVMVFEGDQTIERLSGANIPRDLVTLETDDDVAVDASILVSVPSAEDSVVLAAPDTAWAVKSWRVMRELLTVIGSLIRPEQLLTRVMDIVFEEVDVDRGVIFLRDEATGEFLPEVVRFRNRRARADAEKAAIVASRAIMNHVLDTRDGVLCSNAIADQRFKGSGKPIAELGTRSVICVPILAREQILGAIHLDTPTDQHTYNEHELRLITAIGYQAGLAIENARLVQAQVERERLAAAGETVAYLSHAIKNILQGLRSGADVVQRGFDRQDLTVISQGWRIVDRNLDKCYALMINMLAFSKRREPQLDMLNVNGIVQDVTELEQKHAEELKVVLRTELSPDVPLVPVDYDGLHQVILNLIANALDAVSRGNGEIVVRTWLDEPARRVCISVADNGPGVPFEQREKIFEPFHSTKGHGGTGLGLAVARKTIREMGGTIELAPAEEHGAEFIVSLLTAEARRAMPGDTQGPPS